MLNMHAHVNVNGIQTRPTVLPAQAAQRDQWSFGNTCIVHCICVSIKVLKGTLLKGVLDNGHSYMYNGTMRSNSFAMCRSPFHLDCECVAVGLRT